MTFVQTGSHRIGLLEGSTVQNWAPNSGVATGDHGGINDPPIFVGVFLLLLFIYSCVVYV